MIEQNDFRRQWQCIEEDALRALRRVGASVWYILGKEVETFERIFAEFWGVGHAIGTGNGMDALEIALRCCSLRRGDKVLTTPLSAFASTLAILRAGGVPVFVDVDHLGQIDLQQCREVLIRDSSIRFLLPVHLYGFPLNLVELQKLKDDFNLVIVEDCAQAIGASDAGITVGLVGQIAATSFYPTKNLGTLGDGGAILTSDPHLAATARTLRNYDQSSPYVHDNLGLNSRLDELQAAFLLDAFLPHLATWTRKRADTAQYYGERIRNEGIELFPPRHGTKPSWHLFPVLVEPKLRESFRAHLLAHEITSGIHYPRTILEQDALKNLGRFRIEFEPVNARRISQSEVSLPIHPFLTENEIQTVADACNSWYPKE